MGDIHRIYGSGDLVIEFENDTPIPVSSTPLRVKRAIFQSSLADLDSETVGEGDSTIYIGGSDEEFGEELIPGASQEFGNIDLSKKFVKGLAGLVLKVHYEY